MEYKYGDLFKWNSGKPYTKQGSIYPVFGSNGIIGYSDNFNFSNKIILGRVGAYCGSVNYYEGNFFATDNTLVTECDESKIIYKYAYYLLKSANLNSFAGGSAQPLITQSILKHLKCALPPLPTQRRIASILSTYDALIQNYKRQIAALQSAASELYKEWFVRFRFPGYKNAKFDNGLPVGWKVEKLGEIGEIVGGGTPSTEKEEYWNGEIPWLSPADLSDNTNIYVSKGNKNITQLGLAKSSAKMMPKDTVLLSSRAPVGYVALAKNPICTNQGFKSVVCNQSKIKPLYLYFFFKMNTNYLQSIATGATFPELSATMMKKIKVLLPSINLQEQFVDTISASIIKADLLFDQITNLTTQRNLLLPRLMSGKLSVE